MEPVPFDIQVRPNGAYSLVSASGELDLATAPALVKVLSEVEASQPRAIVLDLSGLTFIDARGLRVVADAANRAAAVGWALSVVRPNDWVMRVFEIAGLSDALRWIERASDAERAPAAGDASALTDAPSP